MTKDEEMQIRAQATQKATQEFIYVLFTAHVNAQAEIAVLRAKAERSGKQTDSAA